MSFKYLSYKGWKHYSSNVCHHKRYSMYRWRYDPNIFDLILGCRKKPEGDYKEIRILWKDFFDHQVLKKVVEEFQEKAFKVGEVSYDAEQSCEFISISKNELKKLAEKLLNLCKERNWQELDNFFDHPREFNDKILGETLDALNQDIDSLAWLCGYVSGANLDRNSDFQFPIIESSKILIENGMKAFVDFVPKKNPSRLFVFDGEKFAQMPEDIKNSVGEYCQLVSSCRLT